MRSRAVLALLLLLLLRRALFAQAVLQSTTHFLQHSCAAYEASHARLVQDAMSQFPDGFSAADVLHAAAGRNDSRLARELGPVRPLLYVLEGTLCMDRTLPQPGGKRLRNFEYFGLPVLSSLAARMALPDMLLHYSPFDEQGGGGDDVAGGADVAPSFGYCGVPQQERALLLPDALPPAALQCPAGGCEPGPADRREPRAVFLGSPTGWRKGKRKAVLLAAQAHPEAVHAGLTEDPDQLLSAEETALFGRAQFLELEEQVQRFKYVVNVEGNCAALRLKRLLASPCAVLFVQSDEIEWFYPLLKPWVHYIPVGFAWDGNGQPRADIASAVTWAEAHPRRVARIVRAANAFAELHLSRRGQECYAARLLQAYALALRDPWTVRRLKPRTRAVYS
jgi:hypothetical protein